MAFSPEGDLVALSDNTTGIRVFATDPEDVAGIAARRLVQSWMTQTGGTS